MTLSRKFCHSSILNTATLHPLQHQLLPAVGVLCSVYFCEHCNLADILDVFFALSVVSMKVSIKISPSLKKIGKKTMVFGLLSPHIPETEDKQTYCVRAWGLLPYP